MIDYLQVQRLSIKNNVSPEIIEKDYLIELVLFYFSKDNFLCENFAVRSKKWGQIFILDRRVKLGYKLNTI